MFLSTCQNIGIPIDEIIAALREAERVTVRELAKRAGTHENTIFRAERGEGINWNTAEKVLDALDHQVLVVPYDTKKLALSPLEDTSGTQATAQAETTNPAGSGRGRFEKFRGHHEHDTSSGPEKAQHQTRP